MAKEIKQKIEEKYTLSVSGCLDLDNMCISVDGIPKLLKDLLKKVDGEFVKFNISKVDELD